MTEEMAVTEIVKGMLEKRVINMDRKWWSNSHYSRQYCLEVTCIPDSIESNDLKKTVLKVFKTPKVMVDPANVLGLSLDKNQ